MTVDTIISGLKAAGTAVVKIVSKLAGAKWGAIIKAGVFVGVSIASAFGLNKIRSFASKKNAENEARERAEESALYTGLRLSPDDFKNSFMHPSMEIIENYNRTIDENIRAELGSDSAEDVEFRRKLKKMRKRAEKKNKKAHDAYDEATNFSVSGIKWSSNALKLFDDFYRNNSDEISCATVFAD